MATVTFDKATRLFDGASKPAVDGIDLEVADGEFLVLVGPSGCGKSTTLRMLAGLEPISSGHIRIGDREVTNVDPSDRDIAMVFQTYALYPHMTVAENMGFALKINGTPKDEIRTRVEEAGKILDLTDYLDRKPKALSGGQRQRVAMGRAIVRSPQVFCMDEPLSNLDAKLRVATRTQIASLQKRLEVTTLYVTHDQVEAMTMGDRVAVLKDGVLQQVDSPGAMYDKPQNVFVAGFIGSPAMNLMTVKMDAEGRGHLGNLELALPRAAREGLTGDTATVGVRPEHLRLASAAGEGGNGVDVVVELVEALGSDAFVHASVAGSGPGDGEMLIARVDPKSPPQRGETISLTPSEGELHWFDGDSGARLG